MSWFTTNNIFILVLAGLGLLLFFSYLRNLARVRASGGWPAVHGTITESWIDESITTEDDGSTSSRYTAKVGYRYVVMGVEFQGDRIAFGPGKSGSLPSAEKLLERYPKGGTALVYYDPEKPADSVLERNISKSLLVAGAVFIAVAVYLYMRWG